MHDTRVSASGLWLSTLTIGETKLFLFPRTRSRTFGAINFIHFLVGSSYAVKSARRKSVESGQVRPQSLRRTTILYATHVPVSETPLSVVIVRRWDVTVQVGEKE